MRILASSLLEETLAETLYHRPKGRQRGERVVYFQSNIETDSVFEVQYINYLLLFNKFGSKEQSKADHGTYRRNESHKWIRAVETPKPTTKA